MNFKIKDFQLYLVTDRSQCKHSLENLVVQSIEGGATAVQLREKNETSKKFFKTAQKLKSVLSKTKTPLIINDRVDIALAAEADGVHLGQSDFPVMEARKILGKKSTIGLSVETIDQVIQANTLDIQYLGVSPVFHTSTKPNAAKPWGLDGLRRARKISRHPLIAIGGIHAKNAQEAIFSGASGLAIVSAICFSKNPYQATIEIKKSIGKGKPWI